MLRGDEVQQVIDLRVAGQLGAQLRHRLVERQLRAEEDPVGLLDAADLLLAVAVALQAHGVEAGQLGAVALRGAVRRHVHRHHRAAGDEGVLADAGELVHRRQAAEDDVVPDLHVAGERGAVGEDAAVAEAAVVGHVAVGHEQVVVADAG